MKMIKSDDVKDSFNEKLEKVGGEEIFQTDNRERVLKGNS
jgi:hypothetical protein